MARILCNVAGGGKPLKGNAETGDVLAGKTFSNKQSNALTGSMPNNGAWSASTSGSGSVTIPAGYHNGSGTVSGSASYNQGYTNGRGAAGSSLTLTAWGQCTTDANQAAETSLTIPGGLSALYSKVDISASITHGTSNNSAIVNPSGTQNLTAQGMTIHGGMTKMGGWAGVQITAVLHN